MKATFIGIITAFLHGNLNEEMYMDAIPGLKFNEDQKITLLKAICGLVQRTR
jgi:hypothetical protein